MLSKMVNRWWVVLLRGLCAILLGLFALFRPGLSLWSLILVYGLLAFADGASGLALGFGGKLDGKPWWGMILVGVLGLLAGLAAFLWPGVTAMALLIMIASWAVVRGVLEIAAAIKLRKVMEGEWVLALSGVLSVLFGLLLLRHPAAGALAVIMIIGAYMVVLGAAAVVFSFRLKGVKDRLPAAM
jgi:uncharacterized membrane protein HdeD (DUF308 family)